MSLDPPAENSTPSDLDLVDVIDDAPDAVGMSEEDPTPTTEPETEPFEAGPNAEANMALLQDAVDPFPQKIAAPDPIEERRFKKAERAVSEVTESRVNMFIGKLTVPGQLGSLSNWLTARKHLIAGDALKLLKSPGYLREHWAWIKFLSGSNLGTGDGEVAILMGMAVYQALFAQFEKNLKK